MSAIAEERWRKPIKVFEWYDDPDFFYYCPLRKTLMRGVAYTTNEEGWDRIRLGYVCVLCVQPQREPYPEKCSMCGFPMKEAQDKIAQEKFKGYRWLGPATSWEDELERLDTDTGPRRRHNPDAHIQVPVGVPDDKAPGVIVTPEEVASFASSSTE